MFSKIPWMNILRQYSRLFLREMGRHVGERDEDGVEFLEELHHHFVVLQDWLLDSYPVLVSVFFHVLESVLQGYNVFSGAWMKYDIDKHVTYRLPRT